MLAVGLRLILAPILAWLIAPFAGLDDIGHKTAILQSAMPAAVFSMVIATKFEVEPEFVTGVVVASTLLSPLTVTVLLMILGT